MLADASTDTRFVLSDSEALFLANEFGTPLYVMDEAHLRNRIREFRSAAETAYPGAKVAFASKANSTLAVLRVAYSEGCAIDVASEGEFRAALAAGIPASACHLHGNNKSRQELAFAIGSGIGQIVVDHLSEIEMITSMLQDGDGPEIMLRLAPGVDPITHEKISTGQADTKFGFCIADGAAEKALSLALNRGLRVKGFHCHVGSQLMDSSAQQAAVHIFGEFCASVRSTLGYWPTRINIGGGLGVRYVDSDKPSSIFEYCASISEQIRRAGLDGVELVHEPGRSLAAESGVTLYTIGVIKHIPQRTFVSVDGGLADNPRPALYGARYTVVPMTSDGRKYGSDQQIVTISGRHCETDKLFADVELPSDIVEGDLVQILCTGAYSASMASNYNRYPRPAMAWKTPDGKFILALRADTYDEMLAREVNPKNMGIA